MFLVYTHVSNATERFIPKKGPPEKIVGGEEAEIGRYPYMASLLDGNLNFCGGTLIDPQWVLSAAHCAGDMTHVLIGHHDFNNIPDTAERIEIERYSQHYNYGETSTDNDIMLVKLKEPSSAPVIKYDGALPPVGSDATVMGWGTTESQGDVSNVLLEATLQVVSNEDCNFAYNGEITENMMCAASEGKDTCQGDSGGPIIIKGETPDEDIQIGVTSWGRGCAQNGYPGVYATVDGIDDYLNFVSECNSYPPLAIDNSICNSPNPCWLGDGICDSDNDFEECAFDGNDCIDDDDDLFFLNDDYYNYTGCFFFRDFVRNLFIEDRFFA